LEAIALTTPSNSGDGDGETWGGPGRETLKIALAELEAAILRACIPTDEWPRRVSRGLDEGVRFVVTRPEMASSFGLGSASEADFADGYELLISRLAALLRRDAPLATRLPASTDEAVVGGVVGLVGDHIRIGRVDRLLELRPDLVLLALLPYLGFAEARQWANQFATEEMN
jgi:hypothetical protein